MNERSFKALGVGRAAGVRARAHIPRHTQCTGNKCKNTDTMCGNNQKVRSFTSGLVYENVYAVLGKYKGCLLYTSRCV